MSWSTFLLAAMAPAGVAADESPLLALLGKLGKLNFTPVMSKDWANLTFWERVKVYDWTRELIILATFVTYLGFYFLGSRRNRKKVTKFVAAVQPVLDAQFGYVGATPATPIVKDSVTRYTTYASGRINVESLLARFRLVDRQNIIIYALGMFIPALKSADGLDDHVEITITPTDPRAIEPGIFAIVNKENLASARDEHYFFKLTKTVDSDKLPSQTYTFMYEHSEYAEALLTPELQTALAHPGSASILRYLAVSDIGSVEPTSEKDVRPKPRVHLSLNLPSSAEEYTAAPVLLKATLDLVDTMVEKRPYRASTTKRIKATRDAELARIHKIEEEAKQEEIEARKAEIRREAAKKERNLSEKEQRKLDKKEQAKQARKQRQKMTRKA